MRQKQSKENSRKHHQKSSPAVKREAKSLSTSTNTIEKNEKARLESRITFGMSYSVSEKEYDKELDQELEERYEMIFTAKRRKRCIILCCAGRFINLKRPEKE